MVSKLLPKHRNEARLSLFQTIEGGSSAACEVVEMINSTNKSLLYSLINICQLNCRNKILKFDHAFMDHNLMPHYCFCDIMNQICCISEKNNQGNSSHDGALKDIARRRSASTADSRCPTKPRWLCIMSGKQYLGLNDGIIFTFFY